MSRLLGGRGGYRTKVASAVSSASARIAGLEGRGGLTQVPLHSCTTSPELNIPESSTASSG